MAFLVRPVTRAIRPHSCLPPTTPPPGSPRRQPQSLGYQTGIDTTPVSRFNKQDQRGDMSPPVVWLRDTHGFDVYHQWRHHERTAERHRPADGNRTVSWQCVGYQSLETELVDRDEGTQYPIPVRQTVAVSQNVTGTVIGFQDFPTPVQ